jgi:hypothetical protein
MSSCAHIDHLYDAAPADLSEGCGVCLAEGGTWVHLRKCQSCGAVNCSDMSPGKHATKHFQATRQPVARSHEGREQWAWCYLDRVEYDPDEDLDHEGASLD